jgi:hypothetical protein
MADVIPTAQALPDGFCPTTWTDTLDAFAAAMRVNLPDSLGQIIISQTTPDPADNSKIWFKVDSNNHVLGTYSYSSLIGDWVLEADYPYYFQDVGAADNVTITTGENISINLDIKGRYFMVRLATGNLTTTPTFKVDSAPAVTILKYGSTALEVGDMAANMIAILLYDGTNFQLLNPVVVITPQVVIAKSTAVSLPANGSSTSYSHGLGVQPSFYTADLICITANNGFSIGDTIPYGSVQAVSGGGNDLVWPALQLTANTSALLLVQENGTLANRQFLTKTTGAEVTFVPGEWNVVFTATLLTN